jgi:predicted GIY-YIG superfamily endonuclease
MKQQSLKILLLDGVPTGAKLVEFGNRVIKAFFIPRSRLEELAKRPDVHQNGIYFLLGSDVQDNQIVYIGIATDLAKRLLQHKKDERKDFWNAAFAFTTRDDSLSAGMANYLERNCLSLALDAKRAEIKNANTPVENPISEIDKAEVEDYLEDLRTVLGVFNQTFLEKASSAAPATEGVYHCKGTSSQAQGRLTDEGFVVFEGSTAKLDTSPSAAPWIANKSKELVANGSLVVDADVARFTRDVVFSSPSGAAAVVLGRNTNGWTKWKDAQGKTLSENER